MKRTEIPKIILLIVFILGFYLPSTAQHNHLHKHEHHTHDEHNFHVGVGAGIASFLGEEGLNPSLHLHLLRKLNPESNWSIGFGYEGIKGDVWHNGLNLLVNYRPFKLLSFNVGPGVVFENENDELEILPAIHAESVVEFTFSNFHLGPMIGFGINKEHNHISFGVHLGFGI